MTRKIRFKLSLGGLRLELSTPLTTREQLDEAVAQLGQQAGQPSDFTSTLVAMAPALAQALAVFLGDRKRERQWAPESDLGAAARRYAAERADAAEPFEPQQPAPATNYAEAGGSPAPSPNPFEPPPAAGEGGAP